MILPNCILQKKTNIWLSTFNYSFQQIELWNTHSLLENPPSNWVKERGRWCGVGSQFQTGGLEEKPSSVPVSFPANFLGTQEHKSWNRIPQMVLPNYIAHMIHCICSKNNLFQITLRCFLKASFTKNPIFLIKRKFVISENFCKMKI